jgi:hypothetical protein
MKSDSKKLREILNAPPDLGTHYIADPKHYEKEVLDGFKMDVVKLNNELDTYFPPKIGELTTFIGHTNVGKTTVILWLLAQLMRKGQKVMIYSAENRISNLHKQIARFYSCIDFERKDRKFQEALMKEIRDKVRYVKHERQYTYKDMLEMCNVQLDAGFDWNFSFIDPYNSLKIDRRAGGNSHEYHYEAAEDLRIYCQNSEKSIFLNCHTVTEAQRLKPDANGHRPAPLDSDVEGGAKFPNKADNTVVLHRQIHAVNKYERYITEWHQRKVRNKEYGGDITPWTEPIRFEYLSDRTDFRILNQPKKQAAINYDEPKDDLPF